jgi:cysteine-rich repeat protein
MTNSTVSGNASAGISGGCEGERSTIVSNSTVAFNVGPGILDIFDPGSFLAIANTIVAENLGGDCTGKLVSRGYNLIEDPTGCVIDGDSTGVMTGQSPRLAPLADNGGPTQTHALMPGSPAINLGNPATPGSGGTACEAIDQRGVSRLQTSRCDMGAYENACGNGTLDAGEECDDGNTNDGDCCSATCKREPGIDVDGNGNIDVATDIVYIARHLLQLVPVPPSFRVTDPTIPSDATIAAAINTCVAPSTSTTTTAATTTNSP